MRRARGADLRYPVVLLRPPVSDEVTADALARVQGELTAAGFEVSTLPRDLGVDVRTALETSGRELEPIATFAIVRDQATAEIWVCDRIAGKSVIQSVRLDAPAAAGEGVRLGGARHSGGGAGRAGDRARLSRRPSHPARRDARRRRLSRPDRRHRRCGLRRPRQRQLVAAHRRRRRT